ncbi:hypothetical protein V2G26_013112 [Clonostachys chloroleuca]
MRFAVLLAVAGVASTYTVTTASRFMEKNFDPIVIPGKYESHLHTFFGSDAVTPTTNTSKELQAGCSTAQNPNDYSSYWVPSLVVKKDNGSVERVPVSRFSAYYVGIENAEIAIPQDFKNVVGNASATSHDRRSRARWPLLTHLQTILLFHDCVNPETLESDYSGTQHWSSWGVPPNRCPPDWKRIPQLRFSIRYDLRKVLPDGWSAAPPLELACGNSYCFHGDFINGWLPEAAENMLLANSKREFAGVSGPNGNFNDGSVCGSENAHDQNPAEGTSDYLEASKIVADAKVDKVEDAFQS